MLNTKQAGSEPHYLSSKDSGNLTLLSMSVCTWKAAACEYIPFQNVSESGIVYFQIKHEYFFTSKTIRFDWVIIFVFFLCHNNKQIPTEKSSWHQVF